MNLAPHDALDAIMSVMADAFDPAFGEAWNRRQVADALIMPSTHYLLAGHTEEEAVDPANVAGFVISRQAADEEELLLIAVRKPLRGRGIGRRLLADFLAAAAARGSRRLFLEMRDGNPAEGLYRNFGFERVGRRSGYYRGGHSSPLDAITFARIDP